MVNVAFVAIYLLVDFIEKFDNFTHAGKSLGLALTYFFLNIPFIVDQLSPVLILLAGVITLGMLNHSNELTALKAGGIPLRKIIQPIIVASILLTMAVLGAAQWILPKTVAKTNKIWYQKVKHKLPSGIYRAGRYYYKGAEGFYSFVWPDPKQPFFTDFSYSRWNERHQIQDMLTAKQTQWDRQRNIWIFDSVQEQHQVAPEKYNIVNKAHIERQLPEKPKDFLIAEQKLSHLSLSEMYQDITKKASEQLKQRAWSEFLGRISHLLLGIPLLLLGLPILLISYQKWGRDLSVAIPASVSLAFVAWGFWEALQSLAVNGYISPLIAATTIHVLFAGYGLFLLYSQER